MPILKQDIDFHVPKNTTCFHITMSVRTNYIYIWSCVTLKKHMQWHIPTIFQTPKEFRQYMSYVLYIDIDIYAGLINLALYVCPWNYEEQKTMTRTRGAWGMQIFESSHKSCRFKNHVRRTRLPTWHLLTSLTLVLLQSCLNIAGPGGSSKVPYMMASKCNLEVKT